MRQPARRSPSTPPGAQNVDWEDLAVARDARGVPSVWLADIDDNDATRDESDFRVDEPVSTAIASVPAHHNRAICWRLRYPGGPTDAEALTVAPGGAGYVVTKSFFGESSVYAVPAIADPTRVQTLRRVAAIRFSMTGTPGGPSAIGQLTATGAGMSADGRLLAVRTYTDAYLWPVSGGDIAALRGSPVRPRTARAAPCGGSRCAEIDAAGGLRRRWLDGIRGADASVPTRSGSVATGAANEPNTVRTDSTGTSARRSTTVGGHGGFGWAWAPSRWPVLDSSRSRFADGAVLTHAWLNRRPTA